MAGVKWADFVIVAVHRDKPGGPITRLRYYDDTGTGLGTLQECTRQEMIDGIRKGHTVVTAFAPDGRSYHKGEDVRVKTNGVHYYLRTDNNNKAEDNLGNLPEY